MKSVRSRIILTMACSMLFPVLAAAQQLVSSVTAAKAAEGKPVSIAVELTQNTDVQRVLLRYRAFGTTEFKELEMLMAGRTATVVLPGEAVLPPSVEYYIEAQLTGGKTEVYPVGAPQATPLVLTVAPTNPKDKEVRLLSPEPGETVAVEDLVVAVSLFYATPAVDVKSTRIMLDGVDVSADAVFTDDVILYSPKNFNRPLNLGAHFLRVELRDTTGAPYHTIDANFALSTATAIAEEKARARMAGNAQLEVRNEALATTSTTYIRGDVRADGNYSTMNFGANIHLDNQNKADRQPQNRFLLYGGTDFLRIQVGDAFPKFPSNIVSGKRVRGISGNLALGFFNLDVSVGQTERKIEGTLGSDSVVTDLSAQASLTANKIRKDSITFQFFREGVYSRNFVAVRPSFGSGENFQLGFTYMKSKDDVSSISYGLRPQENLVVGTDLMLAFDDQHVKLETQVSTGIYNNDISGGSFTQAQYDSLKASNPTAGKDIENLGKIASKFITVNQNLFPTNPISKGLPGLAGEAVLSLNYLNNYIRFTTFHRGAAYKSFGNEFLQTDVGGFQFADNIRLFSNRVYASISYEHKADNTADTKEATTTFNNLNTSVSVNPGSDLPIFQLGYGRYSREAGMETNTRLALTNRLDSTSATASADEGTNRFFAGATYDFVATVRHTATFNISIADRKDNTFYKRNQNNLYLQTAVLSNVAPGWQTTVGVVYSKNRTEQMAFYGPGAFEHRDSASVASDFNYTILTLGAQAKLMGDDLKLLASVNPAFGAFSRQDYQVGAEYTLEKQHVFLLQGNFIQNSGAKSDFIFSFIYRLNF